MPDTHPYLLLLWTPFHRWRNWSWDFHKSALLVSNKVQNETHIFWFQIPHDIYSILCYPSALMEAMFKPKGTVDAGTRLEARIQVGSIWGSQLILKGDYLQIGQTSNPLKHWSPQACLSIFLCFTLGWAHDFFELAWSIRSMPQDLRNQYLMASYNFA